MDLGIGEQTLFLQEPTTSTIYRLGFLFETVLYWASGHGDTV
jgi:hypothetical protein